jgi:hybrid cluster-associated redox disulfide protein
MINKINKEMTFNQIVKMGPEAAQILANYHLDCADCLGASSESLAHVAKAHSLDVDEIVAALNAALPD